MLCSLCYHNAIDGTLLCETCTADWKQSQLVSARESRHGYRTLTGDGMYGDQQAYVDEFFARCEQDGLDAAEAMRQVTRSICNEIGCKAKHC